MKKFVIGVVSMFVLSVALVVFVFLHRERTTEQQYHDSHLIEGVVADVNFIAQGTSFNAPDIEKTIVSFNDGRVRVFNGICKDSIQKGKINEISFLDNTIVEVKIKS